MTKSLHAEVHVEHFQLIAVRKMKASLILQVVAMHFEADFFHVWHLVEALREDFRAVKDACVGCDEWKARNKLTVYTILTTNFKDLGTIPGVPELQSLHVYFNTNLR